ncbi:cation:dicarboxylase symporter family transporter [Leucobacter insecticola]|uniref:Cation:dicarboxylase symporter family transporter n=1 Tax=Leucobacter insecticola TaxID=2714934 RepID=A0A6G8FLG0_9MICO|nr:cation:dicarboxylase symporter family transporter [Leucobacter insecticola]QIM17129.1 cation:dicarboxylase symporter family transporter [Leucobacter insecticola]
MANVTVIKPAGASPKRRGIDKSHYLYIAVIVAVVGGAVLGLAAPEFAKQLKPLGDAFVALIKMMIAPVIFCTIALGVGSVAKAATIGKVGGLALGYFVVMSTFALAIGLFVGNLIHPGNGLDLSNMHYDAPAAPAEGGNTSFLMGIIPTSLLSSLTAGNILQTLFVALLTGFALQRMGEKGQPILTAIGQIQTLVFRLLTMIMWVAPVGAFGAIAAVVGSTGFQAIVSMATLMIAFYITCALFIVVVLGSLLWAVARVSIFRLMKYLAREYLLIFSTSSSEPALPRLIAKMEHLGVSRPVVGVTVPTGYSFNLDGTAIYLTMAALFVATAMGKPLMLGEQISLLVFMIIASKGAAGVTGAGIATLAGGLQSHRPDLVDGVGLIVGIDRFMSEARALTNFTGNAVATVLVGTWTREINKSKVTDVLSGRDPFIESMMAANSESDPAPADPAPADPTPADPAAVDPAAPSAPATPADPTPSADPTTPRELDTATTR